MPLYAEQGIVLRYHKLGEADRIVTILTQGEGKIRAVAKGVRKTRSKFGARLDPYTHVDLILYRGRDLDIVSGADIISAFPNVRADYARFTAAQVIAEAVEKLAEERERNTRLFLLTLNAFRSLDADDADPDACADGFLLRVTTLAGFRPSLDACAECGDPAATRFNASQGGLICERCRDGAAVSVGEATIPYLRALVNEEPVADVPARSKREGGLLIRTYLEYHLNRPLRAPTHLERS
jgi:DNA repair protein RecO (recombination protein O)